MKSISSLACIGLMHVSLFPVKSIMQSDPVGCLLCSENGIQTHGERYPGRFFEEDNRMTLSCLSLRGGCPATVELFVARKLIS